MKLYHYGFKKEILSEGLDAYFKHSDTKTINNLIFEEFEDYFGRDYCVFLNFDKRDEGEILVSVDSNNLNKELLYVADQDLANSIYEKWYKGYECKELIKEYVKSIIPFNEYIENTYENAEIMYLDCIDSDLLVLEKSYI